MNFPRTLAKDQRLSDLGFSPRVILMLQAEILNRTSHFHFIFYIWSGDCTTLVRGFKPYSKMFKPLPWTGHSVIVTDSSSVPFVRWAALISPRRAEWATFFLSRCSDSREKVTSKCNWPENEYIKKSVHFETRHWEPAKSTVILEKRWKDVQLIFLLFLIVPSRHHSTRWANNHY